jgi:hypothetical protein
LRLINIRALLDHSTRNRWNILKNFWQCIPPPPVIPVACSFQGPTTTTRLASWTALFSRVRKCEPPWAAAAIVCANTQTKYSRSSYPKK